VRKRRRREWYEREIRVSGGITKALLSDDPQEFRTDSTNRISADGCALAFCD